MSTKSTSSSLKISSSSPLAAAGKPKEFMALPGWLRRAIRDENVMLFLLGVRWLSLLPPLLQVLGPNQYKNILDWLVLGAAIATNVALSVYNDWFDRQLLRRPCLLAVDLLLAALFLALTGGSESPYGLYAMAPLLAGAFFFEMRGGLLSALALSAFYVPLLAFAPREFSLVAVLGQVMGFFLIALMFGYPSVLLRRLKSANEELQQAQADIARGTALATLGKTVAHVSHEVRNPLVTMGGFARQMQRHPENAEMVRHHSEIIAQETHRLELLLNDVLTVARPTPLQFTRGNVHEVLDRACLLAGGDKKNVNFVKDYDPSLPWLYFNAPSLLRALLNVLRNAVQVMPDGGNIQIATRFNSAAEHAHIIITDSGPGIPDTLLKTIFEPFVTGREEGTGLGLAITRQIIHEHGGTLHAQNLEGKSGGAQFTFELPLAPKND